MADSEKAMKILEILQERHEDAPQTYLNWENPYQLLIVTILSAHTTDAAVNSVSEDLFKEYPTPKDLANADDENVIDIITKVGTYNRKTRYIKETAEMMVEEFGGEVPKNMKDLVEFTGVSRKTANVVLQTAFDINEGVVVDTHVGRVTKRLGLTKEKSAKKIEQDLMDLLPTDEWDEWARIMGAHGRDLCSARNPDCPNCPVNHLCPSAELEEANERT